MNGIKHELVGSAAAAAAAAAYQNQLLYTSTPSWMNTENFPGKVRSPSKTPHLVNREFDACAVAFFGQVY